MSFFNPKRCNRKRRGWKKVAASRQSNSWIHSQTSDPADPESIIQQHHKLNARIGMLEDFLAGRAMVEERRDQMRRNNILPPPENNLRLQARRRMSAIERRRYLAERNRGGIRFFILFCLVCGILWWLLKSGL